VTRQSETDQKLSMIFYIFICYFLMAFNMYMMHYFYRMTKFYVQFLN